MPQNSLWRIPLCESNHKYDQNSQLLRISMRTQKSFENADKTTILHVQDSKRK